jgi:TolA-binding protein
MFPNPENEILTGDPSLPMSVVPIKGREKSPSHDALSQFENEFGSSTHQSVNSVSHKLPNANAVLVGDIDPLDEESILKGFEEDSSTKSLPISHSPMDVLENIGGEEVHPSVIDSSHDHGVHPNDYTTGHVSQAEMENKLIDTLSRVEDKSTFHDEQEYLDYVKKKMAQARLAAKSRDIKSAERDYLKVLTKSLPDDLYQTILMELGRMYKDNDRPGQAAAIYEKFVADFPKHERSPIIHLNLARLYREMGAPNSAINSYYDVINAAVALPSDENPTKYRRFSLTAQFEIAETYLELSNEELDKKPEGESQTYLEKANRFLDRLLRLPLDHEKKSKVVYRAAYARYKSKDYAEVVTRLDGYAKEFPSSDLVPEAYYLESIAYKELEQPKKAVDKVIELLNANEKQQVNNPKAWAYWKKKTGNQLANTFYEDGNFFNALQIYQALYKVDQNVSWQASILYQIGLCFERLGMFPKALEAYQMLSEWSAWQGSEYETNQNLALIKDMATWRKDNLSWSRQADNYLNKITIPEVGE